MLQWKPGAESDCQHRQLTALLVRIFFPEAAEEAKEKMEEEAESEPAPIVLVAGVVASVVAAAGAVAVPVAFLDAHVHATHL